MIERVHSSPPSLPSTRALIPTTHRMFSASEEDLRRRVRESILHDLSIESPRVSLPASCALLVKPTGEESHLEGREGERASQPSSRITILGPLPPQMMELSSSEGSNATTTHTIATIPLHKSASTADLPQQMFSLESGHLSHSPLPIRHTKSYIEIVYRHPCPSTPTSDKIDWMDYSATVPELEDLQSSSSVHTPAPSEASEADCLGPIILVNEVTPPLDHYLDRASLLTTLHECLKPARDPSITLRHRASKQPILPTLQETPSPSPTDQVVARRKLSKGDDGSVNSTRCLVTSPRADSVTDTESTHSYTGPKCFACGRKRSVSKWMKVVPCGHTTCSTCFSSSLSAVSVSRHGAKCPGCLEEITTFWPTGEPSLDFEVAHEILKKPLGGNRSSNSAIYPVLRIDNVAWDITPEIAVDYLPSDVLPPAHPQPIHILLDRFDGRTKDYMYIEVRSYEAARKILKCRQNSFMPGGQLTGGRKRPVTISLVPQAELLTELRPRSAQELHALLALCQAAVVSPPLASPACHFTSSYVAPSGLAHFVKNRHGPFHALLSILAKMSGRNSPAYWDLFYVASGAMTALGTAIDSLPHHRPLSKTQLEVKKDDMIVLDKLSTVFLNSFRGGKTQLTADVDTALSSGANIRPP